MDRVWIGRTGDVLVHDRRQSCDLERIADNFNPVLTPILRRAYGFDKPDTDCASGGNDVGSGIGDSRRHPVAVFRDYLAPELVRCKPVGDHKRD